MDFVGNVQLAQGSPSDVERVLELLGAHGIAVSANPDLYVRTYGHFGIDEARDLAERASSRAVGERRVFVVAAATITHEAQNALLKTLEETPGNALFVIVHPAPHALLSTLRSRAQPLALPHTEVPGEGSIDAARFLRAAPAQRLELLKPLLERGDDDRRDMGSILAFLSSLERLLAAAPERRAAIDAVYRARHYAADKGSLLKPLLEQVALLA